MTQRSHGSLALALALAALTALAPAAAAGQQTYKMAMVPLSSLGTQAPAPSIKRLNAAIERSIRAFRHLRVVPGATLKRAVAQAGKPELSSCDGSASCLTEIGKLVGADYTVFGEVGGLGNAQVVYLKLVAVKAGRTVRSTTLEFDGKRAERAAIDAAVTRLVAPDRYTGNLDLTVDIEGATIYIDGDRAGESPSAAIPLSVGSHALRVTHPEFRDFVRFIEIEFRKSTPVKANLQQFPVVASSIRRSGQTRKVVVNPGQAADTPWYREWYTVTGIGVGAFALTFVVASLLTGDVDADSREPVDVPNF